MKRASVASAASIIGRTIGMSIGIGALVLAFAGPSTAMAQKKGKKASKANKVKSYDFTGDNIDGDLVKPDGVDVNARTFASHTSLIRIRKDFIKEILKSAEDL